jgi:capsular polysaccharide biosynthesis protein
MHKPSIYMYKNAIDLPKGDLAGLHSNLPTSVYLEPPGTKREFVCRPPAFLDDPDNVQLFPTFSQDTIAYPPAFVAMARNAQVIGYRSVLSEDGIFFNDDSLLDKESIDLFLAGIGTPDGGNEESGLKREDKNGGFWLDSDGRDVQRIEGTAILLSSSEPSNYGSWLFRSLPKLHIINQLRLSEPRFLVWSELESFRDLLQLLGISKRQLIHHHPPNTYHVDQIIVPSIRNNQAFLDPESRSFFADLREKLGTQQQRGKRIYVSRLQQSKDGSTRCMRNESELVRRLYKVGFKIVQPEMLSVTEQIRAFSSAEMVVGPSGSGMFNVVFCHPGTKVIDIESEPHWIHAHRCLFSSCDLNYGIFVGKPVNKDFRQHHKPWSLNIDALLSRIAAFSTDHAC